MGFSAGEHAELLQLQDVVRYDECNNQGRGGARHLSSVLPAVSAAIGSPISTAMHADAGLLRAELNFPKVDSAIVVLIDGMGFWNIVDRKGHAPYLRSLLSNRDNDTPISSCVPSTTVAAMGVFGTGTCPGLTGMTGYSQLHPQRREISQMIKFTGDINPEEFQRQSTIFEALRDNGVCATSVGLPQFAHSALTRAALRGSTYVAGSHPRARIDAAAQASYESGLTYLYIRDADKMGHQYGWDNQRWIGTFERIDSQLRSLASKAKPGTLIVITADHGMINSNPASRIDIAQHEQLKRDVELIGGEPRAVSLYLYSDVNPHDVKNRWLDYLGDKVAVYTKQEAIDAGIYGLVNEQTRHILGDIIVFANNDVTVVDSRTQQDMATRLPSVHGSMTAAELDIPLFVDIAE
ncbi:alkaline phosphatase family protein [Alloscardovia venturai]|uniref:Alkaline phosphatase family protein n=1 Tax=Alloscardovia venturai TaxID=1769421 RepID=A0ABW2Y7Y8_9BIFI